MINSICLFLMAFMGIIGFGFVTFFNNASEQRTPPEFHCYQFSPRTWSKPYLLWLNRVFNRALLRLNYVLQRICNYPTVNWVLRKLSRWAKANGYGYLAWILCLFFAYFPIAIIEGQINPDSSFAYTVAFPGDVVGMAFLTWAIVIRRGNIACLLRPSKAKKELKAFGRKEKEL